ncbi:MAG: ABC transporter substrate-binding protein [Candidatus Thorarchaeota archaeon]|jgi:ABC-type transport system substrate-binding protein
MRKGAIVIIVMLFVFPAIALPLGSWTNETVSEGTDSFIVSESLEPPEGIVSWWTGDENAYDYVGDNHGSIEGRTTFAPGMVDEAFSFFHLLSSVSAPGDGIDYLQEFTMECWVSHTTPLQSEMNRYVTLAGEKAVICHKDENLRFYMTFPGEVFFQETHSLVIPRDDYNPFTGDPIEPDQFSFVLIEGLEPGGFIHMLAEFTNQDSDFMVWPADMPWEERSWESDIAGNGLTSGRVPEVTSFQLPDGCDAIEVGCFDFSRDEGSCTITVRDALAEIIDEPIAWDVDEFHHVAASYDGDIMRLYMDGEFIRERFVGRSASPGRGVVINSWAQGLNGLIDEVAIYNHALGDEEILSIFEAGSAGKTKPPEDYHLYSRFYTGTQNLAGVGGWVESYGNLDEWGDEIQWLYCVGDMSGYKISVTLTDYGDDDPLSPGWIEPHQHPDNPDAPGPVEPREFVVARSPVYLHFAGEYEGEYYDEYYTQGAGWHSDEFHADERGVFLGAWPFGIFQFDHNLNDDNSDGVMDYPAELIAYPPPVPPDPNNIGRTETLAYNPDDNIWYAGERCLGWEYRNIWELVDTDNDGDFLDEEWTVAFSYPSLNPNNPSEHHDGLDYAAGCLWISDMYSDRIAQWENVDGIWIERNILEYIAAAHVEGMGFGPNDHLWSASLRYYAGQPPHLYEFGGGVLQEELAAPVYVDIKPASWPNPINTKEMGVLPIAICGTEEYDVSSIDPATVALGSYDSNAVVYPLRWSYEDVATPFLGEPGGGHALDGDGYTDLVLMFDMQELIETLNLAVNVGEVIPLIITGAPISPLGAHIRGLDYVWILDQQGIFGPPEFLRFFEGGLEAIADGYADLSSEYMWYPPGATLPYYPELSDESEFHPGGTLRNGYGLTVINCDKYPLNIAELRQALAYALDKHATAGVWEGHAQPHDSVLPIVNPLCAEGSLPVNYYDANIALGNQLLDDAGFHDVDFDEIREAPDETEFNVVVETADTSNIAMAVGELVVEALLELGIDASLFAHDFNEWFPKLQNHEDFDMIFLGHNFGFDIKSITETYHSYYFGAWNENFPNFQNDDYDFWVEQVHFAEDYDEIQEAAFELQKIFAYECPVIICYENVIYSPVRRPLDNFQVSSVHGATNFETFVNLEGIYPDFETVTSAVFWPGALSPLRASWWYGSTDPLQYGFNPLTLVYESLARLDINGNLVPQLAKSWTIDYDADGQFFDVVSIKDIMWHDGRAFSVEDILFTLTYIRDHAIGPFADACSHVEWIEIVNDRQVRVHLDNPSYWTVERLLQVPILPEHIWQNIDDPYNDWDELVIGTGPFALYEYYSEEIFGNTDLDLADNQLVSGNHPELGTIWTPEDGDYLIGVDFWNGDLPLEYTITITYDGYVEDITETMTWEDVIIEGQLPQNADEIEKLHYVWLPAGVEVTVEVDWDSEADLDIYLWSPSNIIDEHLLEIVLQRWPPITHMDIAYSIGHYYPAPAPNWYDPHHVLQKGTMLTIGWGRSAYGTSAEEAEQNLVDKINAEVLLVTINGKAISDIGTGYLWEYLSVEYDTISNQFRAYVPFRYYLKAQPAGEYEIYWKLVDPIYGTFETTGYVVWVKG